MQIYILSFYQFLSSFRANFDDEIYKIRKMTHTTSASVELIENCLT